MPVFRHPFITLVASAAILGTATAQAATSRQTDPQPPGESPRVQEQGASPGAPAAQPQRPAAEVAELRAAIQQTIDSARWEGARWGVIVSSLDRGDTLFSMNPDVPLAPASNMKLFSTAAAMYYLGPDYRFSTYLLADGDQEGGVLHGDVVLYGTGDPAISARMLGSSRGPLNALADSLLAHGVREVRGDVVGDGSYFDAHYLGEGWSPEYRMASYSAPVGGLQYADNMVSLRVTPGAVVGDLARITSVPLTSGLAVRNEVRTVASGATRVRFEHADDGLVVTGQIARGNAGVSRSLPVVDPVNYTAAAFRAALEERGIVIRGGVRTVTASEHSRVGRSAAAGNGPAPRVMAVHLSPTLQEVVNVTNKISQNLYAEALLKAVGRAVLGEGSAASGARAIQYMLECETGLDAAALQIADGSGLSRLNQVTPRATLHLLEYMARSGMAESFSSTLPEAGAPDDLRHSLRNRLGNTPAARNLRAKTGTINRVSSLAGYVNSASGERLAFVIFVNETPSTAIAKRIEDAIGRRLASFERGDASVRVDGTQLAQGEAPSPEAEPAPEPEETRVAAAPETSEPAAPRTHRVGSGDTLDGISRRYGTTVRALENANPGLNPRRLQLGQEITIPR